ncbi:MarR family winged helix-turn-helix transcriptional regulator [Nocardioides cavernaquae]|uniref:MarR family transcriptional regulator n=1 Tax=Nocardioides cavernaquae TaxID=2321396 RepID=A0A3A5H368_9ACTN|nr:MarR family transcriptional regulator [Nocardioides cavernaquae]RJS45112.1 MarR family transcriptional regulator [Nocardioides cavernaquae]
MGDGHTAAAADVRWLNVEEQGVWRAFLTANTLLMAHIDEDAKRFDLNASEYAILVLLSEAEGQELRMAHLADALCHSRSRVTHTVQRMEHKGLVVRIASGDDRRGVIARLTDAGQARLTEAAPDHVALVRRHLFDLVSPEDLAVFGRVLNAISDDLAEGHPESDLR